MKILVVDDIEEVRTVTGAILSRSGYEVILAEDGVVALEQLSRHTDISLVVLDVIMPKKDGLDTLLELRESWPDLPVLLCSGHSEKGVFRLAQSKAQGFLKKPFSRQQLLEAISNALAGESQRARTSPPNLRW